MTDSFWGDPSGPGASGHADQLCISGASTLTASTFPAKPLKVKLSAIR